MKSELFQEFIDKHSLNEGFSDVAPKWFNPLAELLCANQNGENSPYFIGLNGCQGAGKSTLTDYLQFYFREVHQLTTAVVSIDDFYLSQPQRLSLANEIHPLLKTRGAPGTHDTELMAKVLQDLKTQNLPVVLPRFDKATDNPAPSSEWPVIAEPVDIVILEGWCWGTPEQAEEALKDSVNELEQNEDPDGTWRTFVNSQLKQHYLPLYEYMDFWLMLKAPSFDCVSDWRKQQEHKLRAKTGSSSATQIMTDSQVERFIQHYQRLTEHSLNTIGKNADLIFNLDSHRNIVSIGGSQADTLTNQHKKEVI